MDPPQLHLASSNALAAWSRTPAPHRRLVLVISHALPPDEVDRYWESDEAAYPHLRHWVVQIRHAIRDRASASQSPLKRDS